MAYQPAPNIAQVQLVGIVDSQMTINDLYFEISGGAIDSVNLATLTGACATWFSSVLAPMLSDDWSAQTAIGIDLTTQTGPRVIVGAAAPGGVSGEAAPNNVAACVSLRTALRGRSARGRNFVPGIPNDAITLNTLDSGFVNDLVSNYTSLVGPGTFSAGWQLVVLSRVTGGVPRANGIGFPVVSVTMTTNKVRSMRSREVGHGA